MYTYVMPAKLTVAKNPQRLETKTISWESTEELPSRPDITICIIEKRS